MKHYITDREAEKIIGLILKIRRMVAASPTIAALYDIEKSEIDLMADISKRISK